MFTLKLLDQSALGGIFGIFSPWGTATLYILLTTFLIYVDANNLYGYAMSQCLPTHDLLWEDEDCIISDRDDILQIPDDAPTGFIYEIDCTYPQELHDYHNDYPLAPERLTIDETMLSPLQKSCFPSAQKKPATKLTPNLQNKQRYVLSYIIEI